MGAHKGEMQNSQVIEPMTRGADRVYRVDLSVVKIPTKRLAPLAQPGKTRSPY